MSAVYAERLKELKKHWRDKKEGPTTIDNGDYNMRLQKAEMRPSEASGNLTVYRSWIVLDGEFKGTQVRDMIGLENDFGPSVLHEWFLVSGLESPEDPTKIEGLIQLLSKSKPAYVCNVRKSRGSDFINVRTKELLETDSEEDSNDENEQETPEVDTYVSFNDGEGNLLSGKIIKTEDDTVDVEVGDEIYTVSIDETEPAEAPKSEDEDDSTRLTLLALVQGSCNEKVRRNTNIKRLTEILSGHEWKESELTEDEVNALKEVGVETVSDTPKRKVVKRRRK